jgi:plasmid maintenance system antidote protein VapI
MRISKICNGQRSISADTFLRISRDVDTSVEFCAGTHPHYNTGRAKMELGDRLGKAVKVLARVA